MAFLIWIASVYAVVSIITFAAYGIDKHKARCGQRRISECTLHLLELAGGWPGAAAGQIVFRHKRGKFTYMLVFVGVVAVHVAVWAGCFWMGWLS